jgi:hypothetical protein
MDDGRLVAIRHAKAFYGARSGVQSFADIIYGIGTIRAAWTPNTPNDYLIPIRKAFEEFFVRIKHGEQLKAPSLKKLRELWDLLDQMHIAPDMALFGDHLLSEVNVIFQKYMDDAQKLPLALWNKEKEIRFFISVYYPRHVAPPRDLRDVLYEGPLTQATHPGDENMKFIHLTRDYGKYIAHFLKHIQFDEGEKQLLMTNLRLLLAKGVAADLMFDILVDSREVYRGIRLLALNWMVRGDIGFQWEDEDEDEEPVTARYDVSKLFYEIVYGAIPFASLLTKILARAAGYQNSLRRGLLDAIIARVDRSEGEDLALWNDIPPYMISIAPKVAKKLQRSLFAVHLDKFVELPEDVRNELFKRAFWDVRNDMGKMRIIVECVSDYVTTRKADEAMIHAFLTDMEAELILYDEVALRVSYWKSLYRIHRAHPALEDFLSVLSQNHERFMNVIEKERERKQAIMVQLMRSSPGRLIDTLPDALKRQLYEKFGV